jgi:hypothetical protein
MAPERRIHFSLLQSDISQQTFGGCECFKPYFVPGLHQRLTASIAYSILRTDVRFFFQNNLG